VSLIYCLRLAAETGKPVRGKCVVGWSYEADADQANSVLPVGASIRILLAMDVIKVGVICLIEEF
jgi:hypothetical protein